METYWLLKRDYLYTYLRTYGQMDHSEKNESEIV